MYEHDIIYCTLQLQVIQPRHLPVCQEFEAVSRFRFDILRADNIQR